MLNLAVRTSISRFVDRASLYSLTNNATRCTILFKYIYLFLFSICFGHTVKENAEALLVATKEIGLDVNADKITTWLCLGIGM